MWKKIRLALFAALCAFTIVPVVASAATGPAASCCPGDCCPHGDCCP